MVSFVHGTNVACMRALLGYTSFGNRYPNRILFCREDFREFSHVSVSVCACVKVCLCVGVCLCGCVGVCLCLGVPGSVSMSPCVGPPPKGVASEKQKHNHHVIRIRTYNVPWLDTEPSGHPGPEGARALRTFLG